MNDHLLKTLYESPAYVAMGPTWSALLVGFAAVGWWGEMRLTAAGARYLESCGG